MSYAKAGYKYTPGSTALLEIAAISKTWSIRLSDDGDTHKNKWISDNGTKDGGWFNGYYDNNGNSGGKM